MGSGVARPGSAFSGTLSPRFDVRSPSIVPSGSRPNVNHPNAYKPKKAVKHVLGICGVFLSCWITYIVINVTLIIKHSLGTKSSYTEKNWLVTLGVYLIHINIVLNPFVYTLFNHRMRRALKKAVRRVCRKNKIHRRSTVFVTNYSGSSHRAALRRHRARYGTGEPISSNSPPHACEIRISDSNSSMSEHLDVKKDQRLSREEELPGWLMARRGSSSFSEFSTATFPDLPRGTMTSGEEIFDEVPSSYTSTMYGQRLKPGYPLPDAATQKNHNLLAGPYSTNELQQRSHSKSKHYSEKLHLSKTYSTVERKEAEGRVKMSATTTSVDAEEDEVFNDKDPGAPTTERDEFCNSPKSILVAKKIPLARRALKKQRTVFFSDSIVESGKLKTQNSKDNNRATQSLPSGFFASESSASRKHGQTPKYSEPTNLQAGNMKLPRRRPRFRHVVLGSSSEEEGDTGYPASWSHNIRQHYRKKSSSSEGRVKVSTMKPGYVCPPYDHRLHISTINEKINYWEQLRAAIAENKVIRSSPQFNDTLSYTSTSKDSSRSSSPKGDVKYIRDKFNAPPSSPNILSEGTEIIRDEEYVVEEILNDPSASSLEDQRLGRHSSHQSIILNPNNLGKPVLGPINKKRKRGLKKRHHPTNKEWQLSKDSSLSSLEEMFDNDTPLNTSIDSKIRKKKSKSKTDDVPETKTTSSSGRRSKPNRRMFQYGQKSSNVPFCVASEGHTESGTLAMVLEEENI